MRSLSKEDSLRLSVFAYESGCYWRSKLKKIWDGPHEQDWHRRIKNTLGPYGLHCFQPDPRVAANESDSPDSTSS